MSASFTPGPWKFEPGESPWVQSDAGYADICEMPIPYWDVSDFGELYANGGLIAAAPELYEALALCVEDLDATDPFSKELVEKARAALAKARGEHV